MQAPGFWQRPPGLAARLLSPLGCLYAHATARRVARPGLRLPVPVICVGNLTAGGAGKTPTVIALAERLTAAGLAPHVVSRGHGGSLTGPVRVDLRSQTAAEVGDEPLLISSFAPTWVARDRAAGGRAAAEAGADLVILDDGFQNPALEKDLSILVVDAETGFGNGLCIPAGPLREPVSTGLARADLVLAIGRAEAAADLPRRWPGLAALPLVRAEIRARDTGMPWEGMKVIAFAGIARPAKFFATLRGLGAELVACHGFPDHAPFSRQALTRLDREARAAGAMLVTTDKDAVRLPAWFRGRAIPLPVALQIDDPAPLDRALDGLLPGRNLTGG